MFFFFFFASFWILCIDLTAKGKSKKDMNEEYGKNANGVWVVIQGKNLLPQKGRKAS